MSLNKEQSQKLKPEVLESIKTIGINRTILKYEGIIGKTTIRRWNDPSIQERDRINAKKRYDSKKDDPEFKKACADAHNRYKNTERGSKIFNEYQKRYGEENREVIIDKKKKYYQENKDVLNQKKKLYNLKNSQKMALAKRRYKQENKDRLNKSQRENYRNNPLFRAKVRVRNDINKLFSNLNKTKSKDIRSENVLGCSYEELLNHLESKFSRGMCWKNMGRWHIDHIIPISKDCDSEEEIFNRNHYTNLQPLWGVENLRKSDNDFYSTEGIQYPLDGIEDSLLLIEWDGFDDKKFYDDDDIKIILEYFRVKYDNIIKFSRDDIYNVVSDYGDEFKNYCIVDVFCVESDYNKAILPYQSIYPHLRFCSDDVDFDELVNFDCSYSKEELEREFYMFRTCGGNFDACCNQNKIVINYQPHFYEQENRLLQDPATYNKLIENRKKYLGKNEDQLSNKELLLGLKHAGMIKNPYSHFSPKWFKAFIEKYDVKRVYDPCGGWGHRLLGGLSLEKYYYNDASKRTFEGVKKIAHDFDIKNCELYNKDSSKFVLEEEYDCVFTCPPYFNVEIYDNGKFKDKEEYLQWWKSTISCCIEGGGRYLKYFAFVISKKYKEDLKGVLDNRFSTHFSFLEEIDLRKNSMSHFSRRDGVKNVGGEVLVIYEQKQ